MLLKYITRNRHRMTCERVLDWFKGKYLPRHHLEISVIHKSLKEEGVTGWCMVEGSTSRPRSFLLEIDSQLSEENYSKTLLHELWHVYQHVKGTPQCEEEAVRMENILYGELSNLNIKLS